MEFSDIRAIISYAYNLHKGNYLETTSFRPSQLEFIRVYIYMYTHTYFWGKKRRVKRKDRSSKFRDSENDSIRCDPFEYRRISKAGYTFSILFRRWMIARRNIFLIHACLPCKFSPNKFSPKVGHRAELCTHAHTSYLSFPSSTRSKLDANI